MHDICSSSNHIYTFSPPEKEIINEASVNELSYSRLKKGLTMELVRYFDGEKISYGVLSSDEKRMICLPSLAKTMHKRLPNRMEAFVTSGERAIKTVEKLLKEASKCAIAKNSVLVSRIKHGLTENFAKTQQQETWFSTFTR